MLVGPTKEPQIVKYNCLLVHVQSGPQTMGRGRAGHESSDGPSHALTEAIVRERLAAPRTALPLNNRTPDVVVQ